MELLEQFFGGYFHQDWPEDESSWQAVVGRYRAEGTDLEAGRVAEEIVQLIRRYPDDDSLAAKLSQLGCYYWPGANDLYRAWLFEVADTLR
ncbi:contact-dependent growth inhibition system immunity protein [Dyella terrae]|uniref:contact-dependent growth inhibition system immunity protein n=1 Tax=Dyella terrae TaxID=522259 RepID=UPI001EFE0C7E|nr:contact-dependent growth inhibition system immunity protein [Dyella terrae]ULU24451.1 CdiI immunity protein [Dyella terrae]